MGVCQSSPYDGAIIKRRPKSAGAAYNRSSETFLERIDKLPQGKNVIAEYVWIDGQAMQKGELASPGMRSK